MSLNAHTHTLVVYCRYERTSMLLPPGIFRFKRLLLHSPTSPLETENLLEIYLIKFSTRRASLLRIAQYYLNFPFFSPIPN